MLRTAEDISNLSFQDTFSRAVIRTELAIPVGIIGPDGKKSDKRFSVYRNNVAASLIDAMAANFPVIQRLVGNEFFAALARAFITENPPTIPMLFRYGDKFAGFLEHFDPVSDFPYLGDVARSEYAWLQSYHAADDCVLGGQELGAVPSENLGELRFVAHPASWIFHSQWPIVTIIARNRAGGDCSDINLSKSEDILLTRPALDVEIRVLPRGGYPFLNALMAGSSLEESASLAMQDNEEFDLSSQITGMLECGLFTAFASGS